MGKKRFSAEKRKQRMKLAVSSPAWNGMLKLIDIDRTTLRKVAHHGDIVRAVEAGDFPAREFVAVGSRNRWHLKIEEDDLRWARRGFAVFWHQDSGDVWILDSYWKEAIRLSVLVPDLEALNELASRSGYDIELFCCDLMG
jgi:hypothetical protein